MKLIPIKPTIYFQPCKFLVKTYLMPVKMSSKGKREHMIASLKSCLRLLVAAARMPTAHYVNNASIN
jgi:hypothetical protein